MTVVRKNIAMMLASHFANYVVPLLTFPYLIRTLGVDNFGIISVATAVAAYGVVLIDWGFGITGVKLAAEANSAVEISALFWNILFAKLMLAPAFLLSTLLYASIFLEARASGVIALMVVGALSNALNCAWLAQGRQQVATLTVLTMACRFLTFGLVILLVRDSSDAIYAAVALTVPQVLISGGSLLICAKRGLIGPLTFDFGESRRLLSTSANIFIANAAANLYTTANTLVVGASFSSLQVGYFSSADRVRNAVQNLVLPVGQASFPHSCQLFSVDKKKAFHFARNIVLLQIFVVGGSGLMGMFASDVIMQQLLGVSSDEASRILRLFMICPLLVSVSNGLAMQVLLPLGLGEFLARIRVAAGLIGFGAALLAAFFSRVTFVGLSTVLAELFLLVAIVLKSRRVGFRFINNA